jgi:hypothetical protein
MVQVDDLVKPRFEQIALPVVPPLPGPHRITLYCADGGTESRPVPPFNLQEIKLIGPSSLQNKRLTGACPNIPGGSAPSDIAEHSGAECGHLAPA